MKIALGIVSLFASGGLQRDCMGVQDVLRWRDHDVHLFAARCEKTLQEARNVTILPATTLSNHGRDLSFARAFRAVTRKGYDVVVGFNKLLGLDVLYCADPSVVARAIPHWKRWLPRYRTRLLLERACFGTQSSTHAIMLTTESAAAYRQAWDTPEPRLSVLPSTVAASRVRPGLRLTEEGPAMRAARGYAADEVIWLWIAAQPQTKGLDRALTALKEQPGVRLLIAGINPTDAKAQPYARLAEKLKVEPLVDWLGHREDIPELMAIADVLLHPARFDTTGQVILEAIVNGLPVITTAVCGFAEHVRRADAGVVLDEPFEPTRLVWALDLARDPNMRARWGRNALAYAQANDFTLGFEHAADIIERVAAERRKPVAAAS